MSQWNNAYAYNNQYQPNSWNSDLNGQYINQPYYPNRQYNANNQYVSFDEFLTQMQSNGPATGNASNYGNVQFQNYPVNQYNFQNLPSTSQTQLDSFNYGPNSHIPTDAESYQGQNPFNTSSASFTSDIVMKSNLTPTATEFVPKCSMVIPSTSTQNVSLPESIADNRLQESTTLNEYKTVQSKSSETNWRERPQTQQSSSQNETPNKYESENTYNRNSYNNQDAYNNWGSSNQDVNNQDYNNWNSDDYTQNPSNSSNPNIRESYIKDNNSDKQVSSKNYQESTRHNQESNSRNKYNDYDYNQGSSSQSSTGNSENRERDRYKNTNNQNRIYNRNSAHWDPDSYNQESSNNQSNNRYDRNHSKTNSKSKNKDSERTFYNSSINKSQDVRNGKGEGTSRRNITGSSRVRGTERNSAEDEQYGEEKSKVDHTSSPIKGRNNHKEVSITELTQRDRLSEQLDKGTLECLVCCERVKQTDSVWSCSNCYHVLHLRCIKKWALTSIVESKWRCPACQNISGEIPTEYRCMCGTIRSPEYQRGYIIAHTCGKSCKRPRSCLHPCTLLCHPGPCPPCQATINKECGCGKEKRSILCSSKLPQVCGRTCERTLECGVHKCAKECHEGPCGSCTETVTQVCYCPLAKSRSVSCTRETDSCTQWSCEAACSRVLACGAHVCPRTCHAPPCESCRLLPDAVRTCPCGKTKIQKDQRKACTDPIPLCENICAQLFTCGPVGDRHFCKQNCHVGPCPPCLEKTVLQCRCGHSSREVPCVDLPEMANNIRCQKKCNKKLSCGRHRCRATCCATSMHRCAVVCGRTLSCQLHRCEEFCHTGHCAPCPRVSFQELACACGAEVLMPPVRCGARPPVCTGPCLRTRTCGHSPHHACHAGDCPPCVVLTTKSCYGQHEERKTIPCSQKEFSCGLPCGKPLPCGKHTCIKTCHKGPCDTAKCTQPCNEKRPSCGHPCAAPCHSGNNSSSYGTGSRAATGRSSQCPSSTPCRRLVRATCQCARKYTDRPCNENARDYAKMMSALAATKIQDGESVDLSEVQRPGAMLKTLECDDECRMEARTRQLALALQIRNPDVSAKLAPRYSEHVRATAAREPAFAHQVHDRLTELVQLAKKSKQKTRSHSFPSMNRQKRQFIHELCEHFGCESVAYDAEPNRNVVATADKEKSWLPAMSVLEVLAREAGKRRVPGPVIRAPLNTAPKSTGGWATLTSTNAWAARSQPKPAHDKPKIDYFDNPPDN